MSNKVFIEGEVVSTEPGYLLVKIDNGFGSPEIRTTIDKAIFPAVRLAPLFEDMRQRGEGLTMDQQASILGAL